MDRHRPSLDFEEGPHVRGKVVARAGVPELIDSDPPEAREAQLQNRLAEQSCEFYLGDLKQWALGWATLCQKTQAPSQKLELASVGLQTLVVLVRLGLHPELRSVQRQAPP